MYDCECTIPNSKFILAAGIISLFFDWLRIKCGKSLTRSGPFRVALNINMVIMLIV